MNYDNPIVPIPEDGGSDIEAYNDELESIGPMTWHSSPWLFTENFLYRRLQTCFSLRNTPFWKNYDVFARQKSRALVSSTASVLELVQFVDSSLDATARGQLNNRNDAKALLEEMLDISLWGNSVDLLLLVHLSVEELQSRQGKTARQSFKQNVVDDYTDEVCELLAGLKCKKRPREIHIVLDNAGFEFLTDLVLVTYLLGADYASTVILHGKAFPWFVSDVTSRDLEFTLYTLLEASFNGEVQGEGVSGLKTFGATIEQHLAAGRLRFEAHPFWTTQHCYARMAEYASDLWNQLAGRELVIFKGDLDYRKLVFDGQWPRTMTFQHALGPRGTAPLESSPGLRILSLRTCKADIVVGLQPGQPACRRTRRESNELEPAISTSALRAADVTEHNRLSPTLDDARHANHRFWSLMYWYNGCRCSLLNR